MSTPPDTRILTPSALNRLVRDLLGDALPQVWVEGELSNVARPASGHIYFTLKDARAQIRCAMFKPKSTWLKFQPGAGMQVLVRARVGLYEARGDYQLIVEHMEEAGEGALQRQFEELKARLKAEGLFDETHKRPLPRFARRIGVITSPSGAAIRDVLSVMGRRFALAQVDVLPVPVQGKESPPAIVAMLQKANRAACHDVLLVTRGGGSLEDLMGFNDETVARAIHASTIPVVSAVGHEVDFSISDFVADLRAPTPSAAAELLVPDGDDLSRHLAQRRDRLARLITQRGEASSQHLDHLLARLQSRRPQARLAQGRERLQHLHANLANHMRRVTDDRRTRLAQLQLRLNAQHPRQRLPMHQHALEEHHRRLHNAMMQQLERHRSTLASTRRALHAVSPLATLERGYAIVFDADGNVVRSSANVASGDQLTARLADGSMRLQRIDEP
ncbi:MAG TPA: exodeoxyribonuclease VII large subunit [Oleiagrimonas sp.]|nr:exodeoxyribonuclease VII large subunit [Oleiagrimonas sp.]